MNVGLSNLATLKGWLLAASLSSSTEYDSQITSIGLGIAAQIEKYCGRKFARTVGDVFECSADRAHLILPRYPIEEITTIEQSDAAGSWSEVVGIVQQQALDRGIVYFTEQQGDYLSRLRVTYTGGYWWNQQEPDYEAPDTPTEEDPDLSALPDGATVLPDDLLLAWKLQCEHVWTQRDKLGLALTKDSPATPMPAILPLLDAVEKQLRTFIRYSID